MYSKLLLCGEIEVVTGLHIGGSEGFSAIGAIDSPVIRDSVTRLPMIPGSSLKGKIRTLIARDLNDNAFVEHSKDNIKIRRLFGSSTDEKLKRSRLIFSDCIMTLENRQEIINAGAMSVTEAKFENTIKRATGETTPRQIERVVRGAKFPFELIYEVIEPTEIAEDFETLSQGLKLLQYDYIGGHGSRGYGKVKFNSLELKCVVGDIDKGVLKSCTDLIEEVCIWILLRIS